MTTPEQDERDHADRVAAADPVQAGIKAELLKLERASTAQGWDPHDINRVWIYQVVLNAETRAVRSMPMETLTRYLRLFGAMPPLNVPIALDAISTVLTSPELAPGPITPAIREGIEASLKQYILAEEWAVIGVGIIAEAMSVRVDAVDDPATVTHDTVVNHPAARPVWYTHMLTSDTRLWTVVHQQDDDVMYSTSGPDEPMHETLEFPALARLVAAMAD